MIAGIDQIFREMFSNNTILFEGFLMIVGTLIMVLAISRNTRKIMLLCLPISAGMLIMGFQPAYWFMAGAAIMYVVSMWSNEFDERELEFNTL